LLADLSVDKSALTVAAFYWKPVHVGLLSANVFVSSDEYFVGLTRKGSQKKLQQLAPT